jgi:cobalt-precorrin 5A hydrolase/precorrin-3B C17-methyltransferase
VSDQIVVAITLTSAGAALADRLPFRHQRGDLAAGVADLWGAVDGLVLICATGIAVRTIGPLLVDKHQDPAVVCVDDGGRWAIALAGGHRGANDLARQVAGLIDAEPVVTTATDDAGLPALDTLVGFHAEGDIAGVTRAWLDGAPPDVAVDPELSRWPLPPDIPPLSGSLPGEPRQVRITDRAVEPGPNEVVLRPASLVVGVGSSSGADPAGIAELVATALRDAELAPQSVGLIASVDLKAREPGIVALAANLGVELRTFPAEGLAQVVVPNPSPVVDAAVGTPSVAEAAALAAAGPSATLVVPKQRSAEATVAIARRAGPEGHLAVVGLGPGDPAWRTPAAAAAVGGAQVVIGYGPYVDLAADLTGPQHELVRSPIGAESDRCAEALDRAARGQRVALVCSGDPGVYAMASLACELAPAHGSPPMTVVPGVTAALAGAALLGAPLGHDHAAVSLSDLLTPWPVIEKRLVAVAEGDMAVSFYNPRSGRRVWQLDRALDILADHRPPSCPLAVLTDVGRPGQRILRSTLEAREKLVPCVDMLSLVVVGSSTTRWIGSRMVTPRGYT